MHQQAKKAIDYLRKMGGGTVRSAKERGVNPETVLNRGEYEALYSGLDDDVKLLELKMGGQGRLFYFVQAQVFQIIAVTARHFRT